MITKEERLRREKIAKKVIAQYKRKDRARQRRLEQLGAIKP